MKQLDSLEKMKESWKLLSTEKLKKEISSDDILKIIRQKSKSELDKIKRKLLIETIISFIFLPVFIIYLHKIIAINTWIFDIYILVIFLILAFPSLRLLKIGRFRNQETKVFLTKFVFRFEQAIKTTLILAIIILPLSAIVGFIIGFISGLRGDPAPVADYGNFLTENFNSPSMMMAVSVIILVLVILAFLFFVKAYYILMYSKHIKNMKTFLNELNKVEE